jgi:hypothetical protein
MRPKNAAAAGYSNIPLTNPNSMLVKKMIVFAWGVLGGQLPFQTSLHGFNITV